MSTQPESQINLNYNLHPLVQQLNNELIDFHPFNSLKFIKNWANKKLKQDYGLQSSDQEEDLQISLKRKKKIQFSQIKRRNAIYFQQTDSFRYEKQIQKNEVAKSIIMISLKNNIFLQQLSFQDINQLLESSQLVSIQESTQLIKKGQIISSFYIIIEGQIHLNGQNHQISKVFYLGDSFGHQSFINQPHSKFSYLSQASCLICVISGSKILNLCKAKAQQKNQFYQKSLMNINQFTYLDKQQLYKLVSMFKQTKNMPVGQIVVQKGQINIKKLFIVVKGQFSKCKRNMTGELVVFKTIKKGDFFGLQWLMNDFQSQYSVLSMQQDSMLAYIQKQNLQKSIQTYERILKRTKKKNFN